MDHPSQLSKTASVPDDTVRDNPVSSTDMALGQIGRICFRQFGINSLQPQLDACARVLGEGDIVDVAVVGRFKVGKSSFLNSIIGRDIMPVAVLRRTAVVT